MPVKLFALTSKDLQVDRGAVRRDGSYSHAHAHTYTSFVRAEKEDGTVPLRRLSDKERVLGTRDDAATTVMPEERQVGTSGKHAPQSCEYRQCIGNGGRQLVVAKDKVAQPREG